MEKRQTGLIVKKVIPHLEGLGYSREVMDFEVPCKRTHTKKFQGETDILVVIKEQPMIVVEVKPHNKDLNLAIEEGKLYALNYEPGAIIPYIIAWAGEKKQMFRAQMSGPFKVDFVPTDYFLTRSEIERIAQVTGERVSSEDILKIETLIGVFEKSFEVVKSIQRPRFTDDETVLAINRFVLDLFGNKEANKIKVNPISNQAHKKLEEIFLLRDLGNLEGYTLATAYREFVVRNFKGKGYGWVDKEETGRYFTPTLVIDFMLKLVNVKPTDRVIDFACGSGGFLLGALHSLAGKVDLNSYTKGKIYGCDVDEFSVWTTKTLLELFLPDRQENLNIFHHNGLWSSAVHTWEKKNNLDLRRKTKDENFDVVISNPPGGKKFNLGEGRYDNYLRKLYPLEKERKTLENAPLFIQRAINLAKNGGRICLIVPEGIADMNRYQYLWDCIKKRCEVKAIISLYPGIFPNVLSKMNIIYLVKTKKPSREPIFMATVPVDKEKEGQINLETELNEIYEKYCET